MEEGFGNADLYVIDQLIRDRLMEHQFDLHGGKEGLKKVILRIAEAFSIRNYKLLHHAMDRNMVWVYYCYSAEHTGPFMGHAPTNKKITVDVMDIAKIEDGKITEHWGVPDRFAVMIQLGFIEPSKSKV